MVNKARRIGTGGENRTVELLEPLWGVFNPSTGTGVTRLGGNRASHDIVGAPVPVETKRQGTIRLGEWTRKMFTTHGRLWLYHLVPRDRRSGTPIPDDLFVISYDMLRELVRYQRDDSPYAPHKEIT